MAALKLETRVVFMRANETSTGVRHCVPAAAKLLKDQHLSLLGYRLFSHPEICSGAQTLQTYMLAEKVCSFPTSPHSISPLVTGCPMGVLTDAFPKPAMQWLLGESWVSDHKVDTTNRVAWGISASHELHCRLHKVRDEGDVAGEAV